jgi:hypothetical protein
MRRAHCSAIERDNRILPRATPVSEPESEEPDRMRNPIRLFA